MVILGLSYGYHDSAAAILIDGELLAAAQEERFTRVKHDASFPEKSIEYLLEETELTYSDIDYVVYYEKPLIKFERLLEVYLRNVPSGVRSFLSSMPIWIKEKLFLKYKLLQFFCEKAPNFSSEQIRFSEHHMSHCASAFFPSPFEQSVIITLDGVGEWTTATVAIGRSNQIEIKKEINFPDSLGLLYSAFTYYLGFKVNSGEYKMMGLAPYGEPLYKDIILENLIRVAEDGSFKLNLKYFGYVTGLRMINRRFLNLFKVPVRKADEEITHFHRDIAASIQAITEEIVLKIVQSAAEEYSIKNICLAGGVALNCVANGKVYKSGFIKNLWIQPASGDAGGAVGAAMAFWYHELGERRAPPTIDSMSGSYLGPKYSGKSIESFLKNESVPYTKLDDAELFSTVAKRISEGKAVGWFQERMEFGPRALGNRSIIADPRSTRVQRDLNLKIKFRESFRPFAPAVLEERVEDWFDFSGISPYMLLVANVAKRKLISATRENMKQDSDLLSLLSQKRSEVPAITHVDFSARIQTVSASTNPRFHSLLSEFERVTGCPILVNTSFNVRGEPIVCNPQDALRCFLGTNLDLLILGNYLIEKTKLSAREITDYKDSYELD